MVADQPQVTDSGVGVDRDAPAHRQDDLEVADAKTSVDGAAFGRERHP